MLNIIWWFTNINKKFANMLTLMYQWKRIKKNVHFFINRFTGQGHIVDVTMIKSQADALTENSERIDFVKCRYSN